MELLETIMLKEPVEPVEPEELSNHFSLTAFKKEIFIEIFRKVNEHFYFRIIID